MEAPLIVGIVFISIVTVIKIITDTVVRNKLIEKGMLEEAGKTAFGMPELSVLSNVKWGIVLIAIGLGLFLTRFLPYRMGDEGAWGLVLVFAGIAFLIYYGMVHNKLKSVNRKDIDKPQ
ncbi:MAG: hypothetical protein JSU65_00640 [Candidatus Zixiibacteriota bacterium]|nr:MAG: hypothetical protein JSU65_00640 [candidate division Zixibacteria bacterium]